MVLPLPTPRSRRRGPPGGETSASNRWFLGTAPAERRLWPGQAPPSPAAGGGAERDAGCRVTRQGLSGRLLGMGFRGLEPAVGWFHSAAVS